MEGLRHEVALVLCSLSVVMGFEGTFLPKKSLVNGNGTAKERSLVDFIMEMDQFDEDDDNELKVIEDGIVNYTDVGPGVVEGREGCGGGRGKSRKSAAGSQLWTSPDVFTWKTASVLFYYKLLRKFLWV